MNESWFEHRPISVFIDNSVFVRNHFNLTNSGFETIKKAVESGDIQIIYSKISEGEFLKHAEIVIRKEEEKIRSIGASRTAYSDDLKSLQEKIKSYNSEILWKWFVQEFKAVDITCDVDWRNVFEDYFASNPPFTAEKKKEFPDSFNTKMIEAHNSPRLAILSSDGDYASWIKESKEKILFSTLNDFTDSYLKLRDKAFADMATKAFDTLKVQINQKLQENYSDDYHYSLTASHSEIVAANVKELKIVDADLTATNSDDGFAVMKVRFRGKTELDLSCPVIVWDSVDKEEIHMGTNSRSTEIEIEINAVVTLFINKADPEDSDYEIEEDELYAEDFDVPDDWTSFVDQDEDHEE